LTNRAADFRLDAKLRKLCQDDISDMCGYERDSLDTVAGYDARVIQCLQDYRCRPCPSLALPKHRILRIHAALV